MNRLKLDWETLRLLNAAETTAVVGGILTDTCQRDSQSGGYACVKVSSGRQQ